MNEIIEYLKKFNTLQIKLVFLFFILTLITTLTTLVSINLSVESYGKGPGPNLQISGNGFGMLNNDDELRRQIMEQIREEREQFRQTVLTLTFVLIGLQIVIALGGSYFVVKSSLNPLKKLNKTMKEINDLNLKSKIIQENTYGEIGEVINNFNSMIVNIQNLVEKEKEFTQNISHELKTPLSAMRVNLESVILVNDIDTETKDSIKTAITAVDSLNKLIEDLTLLSSIEKKNYKLETFDAIEVVKTLINEECDLNSNANITFKSQVKSFKLNGSSALFKRAICNLIENGIKYSKNNPEINVAIKQENDNLQIIVSDNGIGIPKDKLNKIFERFYRIDNSRSRATGGSGLGLALTKEIIDLFKGQIKIESELELGTTFIITIAN